MTLPLTRALIAAEEPVLAAHDIPMWGYVVLTALAGRQVRTQAALAQAIGADKSRIIGVLDDLEQRSLLRRHADPADRRVRLLSLTEAGEELRRVVQSEIQAGEERLLAQLPEAERAAFLRSLRTLARLSRDTLASRETRPA
jgi:DNA-binding MarR family transcriptional regulator